ncbi:hypothetical protein B0H14DRAFT_2561658 [Mycena olivaceomarginata]|nr:hypothetical protein B0H14DRAFT_2561658 [Mycena olivaceomarginata]
MSMFLHSCPFIRTSVPASCNRAAFIDFELPLGHSWVYVRRPTVEQPEFNGICTQSYAASSAIRKKKTSAIPGHSDLNREGYSTPEMRIPHTCLSLRLLSDLMCCNPAAERWYNVTNAAIQAGTPFASVTDHPAHASQDEIKINLGTE